MATIKTKFNVGDEIVTLDKETKKVVTLKVGHVTSSIDKKGTQSVSYYPINDSGDVDFYSSYDEKFCFGSKEQLLDYITK